MLADCVAVLVVYAQGSEGDISFFPHMMEPGDDVKVRDRLLEVLEAVVVGEEAEARARL